MTTPNAMYANGAYPNPLIDEHIDLVKRIAYRLHGRLPDSVQVEDLIQAGMLGLLEAHERFRADEGASFTTFAGIRIRGAMLDEIRRGDWAPRSLHRAARAAAEARRRVEARKGSTAGEAEIAAEMDLSLADYRKTMSDIAGAHLCSLDDGDPDLPPQEIPAGEDCRPLVAVEHENLCAAVADASSHLPDRERLLMSMYYEQNLNLRQIAETLGVSESRACQLHGRAISRVREQLSEWAA